MINIINTSSPNNHFVFWKKDMLYSDKTYIFIFFLLIVSLQLSPWIKSLRHLQTQTDQKL